MIARWAGIGFGMWLLLALAFRFLGQGVFRAGPDGVTMVFLLAPILLGAATYTLLRALRVTQSDRSEAASVFAVTGLVVGVLEINNYTAAFPNLPPELSNQFAALMFACFAAVVFVGLVSSRVESI